MQLVVNGTEREFNDGTTGRSLLEDLVIPPDTVVVELNGEIVKREEFLDMALADGDSLEIVTIVGGG